MPFVETGEFANVGVVMFAPTARYFGFKLLGGRYARVTNFSSKWTPRFSVPPCVHSARKCSASTACSSPWARIDG
ncbi:DUF3037 domain-containing protein [Candidatus Skiveiella danica]|uniref:DUF3037 domain-containing protein n=1 Tax=Candidatus Skiveiella danica TaxID=3386177 RepID=UPI0039B96C3F